MGNNFQISHSPDEHNHYFPSVEMKNGKIYTVWNSTSDSIWANMMEFADTNVQNIKTPNNYILFQNYPNPFNSATTINFSIPNPTFISLKIYNLRESLIETLIKEQRQTGEYQVQWNTENPTSGIYLYRLEAGQYVETRKMLLVE